VATPPISEVPEVEQQYLVQAAIVGGLTASADELWPILDPTDLAGTVPTIQRGLVALVDRFSQASISTSADYYEDLRSLHIAGRYSAPIVDATPAGRVRAILNAIASPNMARANALRDDLFLGQIATDLVHGSLTAAQSLVADAGSDQIFTALHGDDRAQGWARITKPGACYFCRMLASRGAVYRTEHSGSFRAHTPKDGRGGYCGCTVEPLFGRYYEPTAQARADIDTWNRVARGHGKDSIELFRREVEGRTDGPRRPRRIKAGRKGKPAEVVQSLSFDSLTATQLQRQLEIIEPLKDSGWRTKQLDRLRSRLAELGA